MKPVAQRDELHALRLPVVQAVDLIGQSFRTQLCATADVARPFLHEPRVCRRLAGGVDAVEMVADGGYGTLQVYEVLLAARPLLVGEFVPHLVVRMEEYVELTVV